jgi:TatA/E family protein of Tat protein translocase
VFGLGFQELVLIGVIALLVLGPAKLPELARSLGKGLAEFRRASNDLRRSIEEADRPAPPPAPLRGPADEVAAAPLPTQASAPAHSTAPAEAKPGEPTA